MRLSLPKAVSEIAKRCRGTPRVANRLLKRIRDFAEVKGTGEITAPIARDALKLLDIDEHGFDDIDRKLLRAIIERFGGGPVGVNTIAAVLSEEVDAIEDIYEPYPASNRISATYAARPCRHETRLRSPRHRLQAASGRIVLIGECVSQHSR